MFIVTCPCPRLFALQAYLTVQPSSGYPTSSGMAHGPIFLLGPFIPTTTYFENLTIELHVLYVLKTHVKFHVNQMLFIIRFINLFFKYKFILQKLEI